MLRMVGLIGKAAKVYVMNDIIVKIDWFHPSTRLTNFKLREGQLVQVGRHIYRYSYDGVEKLHVLEPID